MNIDTDTDIHEPDRNPMDVLAEQFTQECREGLRPSVEDYARKHPELAEKIRNLFPSIQAIEQLGSHAASEKRFAKANAVFDRNEIEQIGDYRIVREIGRGGMGIVYEAIQQSLGRHVAIKLLLQTSTAPKHLQRFEREARTAANLHHTNIVPVFGVGSQDGFHYYVMQLIEGVGLDRVIEDLRAYNRNSKNGSPQPAHLKHASGFENVARIGRNVADALQYAHDQGTLHRDIKPANLLLDSEGAVWVADFGLAKAMEDSNVSRTGEVIGTLRFMAPEQFAGNPDPRSDVYSLGLTIYELLTLKPAWDENSRSHLLSGAHSKQTQIVSPIKLDSRIPRDLETIVMKACAREPNDRYRTAGDLAHDLDNFLEGRPINARPPYSFEVFAKWCRRNPAIASLSGLTAMLLTLVAVLTSIGYFRANTALKRELEEKARTVIAKRKAEQTLGISLQALDRVYKRFVPDQISATTDATLEGVDGEQLTVSSQAMLSRETAALLEDVLSFYDQFAKQDSESLLLKREAAKANRRVGDIHRKLGDYEKSVLAYDTAVDMYEEIGDSNLEIARIQTAIGDVFHESRERDLSEASYIHAKRLLEELHQANPDAANAKYELARTLYRLSRKRPEDSGRRGPQPPRQSDDRQGPPRDGERREDRPPPSSPGMGLDGPPPRGNRNSPELNRAIRLLEELRSQYPQNPDYQFLLAVCHRDRNGGPGEVDQPSIDLLEELCERYPQMPDYRFELAETLSLAPHHGLEQSEAEESIRQLRESLEILERLVASHPNIPQYMKTKAHAHHKLGTMLRESPKVRLSGGDEQLAEALKNLRDAVAAQLAIHEQFPDSAPDLLWLARMRENLAEGLLQNNEPEQALEVIKQSIAESAPLAYEDSEIDEPGNRPAALHTMVIQYEALFEILNALGRGEEADQAMFDADIFRAQLPQPPRRRENGP
ncbi:serine/threonine-protein kinase [Mariniblastus fucicola]|uniref:Serine/threonine-protein kinase PrkC n=1 Tax=Mariniblastus fucicola TaxID=980251 RepID=A0A5B9PIJ0_9BACT|nr:serine/threonine-protein kinase [Mariniblastus fucicola]QEG25095.1 Serine/threonine-protein kinase PrkC [Mariniblastus fucicola]